MAFLAAVFTAVGGIVFWTLPLWSLGSTIGLIALIAGFVMAATVRR